MHPFALSRRTLFAVAALVAGLSGCATMTQPVNVADTIARTPSLSTLNTLVTQAGLAGDLRAAGPLTVFAPSNDAFKSVPAKTMADLAANPAMLKAVLTYHVIPGKLGSADIKNSSIKSLNGAPLALAKAGTFVTVENAAVTQADLQATNGVVHVVDTVLLPPAK